jgi:hypothetical protein
MTDAYTVSEISSDNVAKIEYSDGTISFVQLTSEMTEAELDDIVYSNRPATVVGGTGKPSFLSEGASRTAAAKVDPDPVLTYADNRQAEYGSVEQQLEYITENGLSAWQTKVNAIKAKYPKPSE